MTHLSHPVLVFRSLTPILAVVFAMTSATFVSGVFEEPAASPADSSHVLKDLDGHFPFAVPETKEAWEERAQQVRRQIEVSLGLFPLPKMAKLQPTVHSRRDMDGYSIEKVYFESLPGFYVTGNLYTPLTAPGDATVKRPAVLCPHGHWNNGRFYFTSDDEANRDLASGAERFESAAHSPLQARCVQLARMGIITFHYDMVGYADCQQISQDRAHGFGLHGPNPAVGKDRWLLFSPQAEGMLQSVMGLQTLNTLQSLEFLLQRSDVDPNRISITGASGGGTQTFIASALDTRYAGAYPVVMVSTSMQGGCTCENASGLRVGTGNVEIAALTAPRPLGVNAANDWTRNMANDGFPELKKLYGLYGADQRVTFHGATHFGHNYNHVTRVVMYGFMNKLFSLGLREPVLEKDFPVLRSEDLTVWDASHPAPPKGVEFEADLLKRWADDVLAQIDQSPELKITGWQTLLHEALPMSRTLKVATLDKSSELGKQRLSVINQDGIEVGRFFLRDGGSKSPVRVVANNGDSIASSPDNLLLIDDAWGVDMATSVQSLVKNPRPAACYTYGYNPPLFVRRLAVLLAVAQSNQEGFGAQTQWVGEGANAALVAAAGVMAPQQVRRVAIDAKGFDFRTIESIRDVNFLPGAIRFGGLDGLKDVHARLTR